MGVRAMMWVSAATALVLGGLSSDAAAGGGGAYDPFAPPGMERADLLGADRRLAAGVSLRIPFGGKSGSALADTRFSVGLAMRNDFGTRIPARTGFAETRPLLELSFGVAEGPKSLALNGVEFAEMRRLYAQDEGEQEENGEEGDGVNWWWVGGGILGAALLAGIIGAAASGDDAVPDFDFEEPQSTGQ